MNDNELIFEFESGNEVIDERYELASRRIKEMSEEHLKNKEFDLYFHTVRDFLEMMTETYDWALNKGPEKDSFEELKKRNHDLYEDILPENYDKSYGNICRVKSMKPDGLVSSPMLMITASSYPRFTMK